MERFGNLLIAIACIYVASFFFKKRQKMVFMISSGILLILFLGLRDGHSGGIDLYRYSTQYETLARAESIKTAFEMREGSSLFFFLSLYGSAKVGISYQLYLFIIAVFTVSASLILYYRYSNYPLVCLATFLPTCYIHLFSQLKQTIAVGIVIFAYLLFKKEKLRCAYILIFIAIMFHPSAVIVIPFFMIARHPVNPYLLAVLILGALGIFIFRMQIGSFLTIIYSQDIGHYESKGGITGMAVILIMITALYMFTMPKRNEISNERYIMLSGYLYALIIAMSIFFCSSYSYSFTRLNSYFMIFLPIVFSEIADSNFWKKKFKSKLPAYIMNISVVYVMVDWFLFMITMEQLEDYRFFWETY